MTSVHAEQYHREERNPKECHYCGNESWDGCWEKEPESTFGMRKGEAYPGQWICEDCLEADRCECCGAFNPGPDGFCGRCNDDC